MSQPGPLSPPLANTTVDTYLSTVVATMTSCYGQFDEVHAECVNCVLADKCRVRSRAKETIACVVLDSPEHTVSTIDYPGDLTVLDIMREVIAAQTKTGWFTSTRSPFIPIKADITIKDWILPTHEFKGVLPWASPNIVVQHAEEPDPQNTIKPK